MQALFFRQAADKAFKDIGPGIGYRINGMAHPVNQAGFVKGPFMQQIHQILTDLFFVGPISQGFFHVFKYFYHLNIGATMLWSF